MDSLTQIVLGAAVGEVVAGKKLGNRAMLWGAVAGTIPDLDVIIGALFMSELDALAFHRGFMHSFTFAILFSVLISFLVHRLYSSGYYQRKAHKIASFVGAILMMVFMAGILNFIPVVASGGVSVWLILISLLLVGFFSYRLWTNYYMKNPLEHVKMTFTHWYVFFFLTIVTHPILDCFTTYGTQVFQPFSDYRVAFNNISVFDPLYTAPFLILVLIAAFLKKSHKARLWLTIAGLTISSLYMMWTFRNKAEVNAAFESSLIDQNLPYTEIFTSPTIANNLLWNCVAMGNEVFYTGFYSILDSLPEVNDILTIPVNSNAIKGHENDEAVEVLRWFSDGYNTYEKPDSSTIIVNDLRFGRFSLDNDDSSQFVFRFTLEKNREGTYTLTGDSAGPPENPDGWFRDLWNRMMGN
ncbi:metal-dependent hydrolase [Portibacter marinus]|uniref:metal-dependent hydrolase n=1 Tax=Portibacter marinus TaxID=2898660 RepID=UPI001F3E8A39|nr:metal-dependent hydrolase [Portibacter marinus]